ncbi:MAG TPA: hypothetical protein DEQ09_02945 [Bacteroidales bacterium]|nr:hypothetical protein [Bacteroidales bacterium]
MKKSIIAIICLVTTAIIYSQSLDNIIYKHQEAVNAKKRSTFNSLIIKGHINMQGMKLSLEIYEKAPDKFKTVSSYNGMEMVQVVNGDHGYMINPLMGSGEAVPLTPEQVSSVKIGSLLTNNILDYYSDGKMELKGEELVSGSPAYKIRISAPDGDRYIFIDKESYHITQLRLTVNQGGNDTTVEMRMSNYDQVDGVTIAMVTDTFMNGQPAGSAVYESIEFNREIDDSVFKIK